MALLDSEQIKALEAIGQRLVDGIREEMEKEGVNASHSLSSSLEYVVTGDGLRILALPYFPYAEAGRESGAVPMDFGGILSRWVERKGISIPSSFKDSLSFGWAIAHNIKTYGSLRKRENKPVDLLSSPIEKVAGEAEEILTKYFLDTINRTLNI